MEHLSETQNAVVGMASGLVEVSLLHWTNTLKTLAQNDLRPPWTQPHLLYRGYMANCGNMVSATGFQFAADGLLKSWLKNLIPDGTSNTTSSSIHIISAFAAVGAGAASALVVSPIEFVMIQQQCTGGAVTTTLKNTVSAGMSRGFVPTMWREGIYVGGYLGLCPAVEEALHAKGLRPATAAVGAAVLAGVISSILSHPADTLKTRIQGGPLSHTAPRLFPTLRAVLQQGGVKLLYAGFGWRCARNIATVFVLNAAQKMLHPLMFPQEECVIAQPALVAQ